MIASSAQPTLSASYSFFIFSEMFCFEETGECCSRSDVWEQKAFRSDLFSEAMFRLASLFDCRVLGSLFLSFERDIAIGYFKINIYRND